MTRARTAALILLCILVAASASAQPKGNARINGKILDDQGKPAQTVVVRAVKVGDPQIVEAKTNDKGEWQMTGLTAGQWNLEFTKEGFDPQRMTVEVDGEPQSADRHEADEGGAGRRSQRRAPG